MTEDSPGHQAESNAAQAASWPSPGDNWDNRFEIIELLGEGSTGRVYKALHLVMGRQVALKIIKPQIFDSANSKQRFQREAALLSEFQHPNIVRIDSFGTAPNGLLYMTLELLDGHSLAWTIQNQSPISCQRALPIFCDIARALIYAHSKSVVHRDLKPENIMLVQTELGEVAKLLDFGIFKAIGVNNQSLTSTGQLLGSANYMSPEQCKSEVVDERSDIYSFACLMYETLVGSAPMLDTSEMLIMSNQINKNITQVPAQNLPADLEACILRCLEKDPSKRFASATELLENLDRVKSFIPKTPLRTSLKLMALLPIFLLLLALAIPVIQKMQANYKSAATNSVLISPKGKYRTKAPPVTWKEDGEEFARLSEWLEDNDIKSSSVHNLLNTWLRAATIGDMQTPKLGPPNFDKIQESAEKYLNVKHSDNPEVTQYLAFIQIALKEYKNAFKTIDRLKQALDDEDPKVKLDRKYLCLAEYYRTIKNDKLREKYVLLQIKNLMEMKQHHSLAAPLIILAVLEQKSGRAPSARRHALKGFEEIKEQYEVAGVPADPPALVAAMENLNSAEQWDLTVDLAHLAGADHVESSAQQLGNMYKAVVMYAIAEEKSGNHAEFEKSIKQLKKVSTGEALQQYSTKALVANKISI